MLAIRLMQLFSENKSDFTRLARIIGLYFQIRDDYQNLCSKDVSRNQVNQKEHFDGLFSIFRTKATAKISPKASSAFR